MGDSAGGNLAAVVALMARDRSGPLIGHRSHPPATDLTLSSASLEENAPTPSVGKRDVVVSRDRYLSRRKNPEHPYASPLLAPDLSGLPPALIQVAEHDPIRDDGLRYARALRAAGVHVPVTNYVGMPHGFLQFPKVVPQCAAGYGRNLRHTHKPGRRKRQTTEHRRAFLPLHPRLVGPTTHPRRLLETPFVLASTSGSLLGCDAGDRAGTVLTPASRSKD